MSYKNEEYAQSAAMAAVTPPAEELDFSVINGGRPVNHFPAGVKLSKSEETLRDAGWTWEQILMRREKGAARSSQPERAGQVLDDMLGKQSEDQAVSRMALKLIEDYPHDVTFNMTQWPHVQRMVEAAIRAGHEAGMGSGLG